MRALTILALLLVACATNPVTGKSQLSLISESQEIEMGRQEVVRARAETGFYSDAALEKYVSDIGLRMASETERPGLPWEFHVVDDPAVNAFAAPGGFIFVTRGIMAFLNSEAELAAVMGHEIGHVTAKHSVVAGSLQQVGGAAIAIGSIFNPNAANIAGQAAGIYLLKYSRGNESQADELGHRYSLADRYDVREMPNTFRTLQRLESVGGGSSSKLPTFLSTHPDPGDRVNKTQSWADTVTTTATLHADRDRYLDRINGMLFGADPQQGYFEGTRFLHPQFRLRFDIPAGWQGMNQASQVVAGDPNGRAQLALTLASQNTIDAAASAFMGQQGLQSPASQRITVNGLPAVLGEFTAATQDNQSLHGQVLFVQIGSQVYQFLGLAVAANWNSYSGVINQSLRSIAQTSMNQQFKPRSYLRVSTLAQPTSVDVLAQRSNGAITAQLLAIMNGVAEGSTIPAGRKIKTVSY